MEKWYCAGEALCDWIARTETGMDEAALWFLGQCGFAIKYDGRVILIDPVFNDIQGGGVSVRRYASPVAPDELKPDFVLCTHGHIDHMAEETLRGIAAAFPETVFVIPAGCRSLARRYGLANVIALQDCGSAALWDGVMVRAFSAAHPSHVFDENSEDMALGYCLQMGDIRIAHLGDTYLTDRLMASLQQLGKLNILLPPINGDDLFRARRNCIGNIGAEEAAALAAALNADLTIPTHYDMIEGNTVDPLRFAAELRRICPTARWRIPVLGEQILYRA